MNYFKHILIILVVLAAMQAGAQSSYKIALLKYKGGGDWYANPTSLPNLISFCNQNMDTDIDPEPATIEAGSPELFNYPFLHMTGHGNVIFSGEDARNLRNYLVAGGFLHIDDNYGMDEYVRREMKKVFPELDFVELPFDHPLYHQQYSFPEGLPKIHEHDNKPPQGFGLIYEGELVCFYSYESDLGDGWEDPEVHNDSQAARLKSLQMGANIIKYALTR